MTNPEKPNNNKILKLFDHWNLIRNWKLDISNFSGC